MSVTVTNTTASLSGKTLAKLEDPQTFTGSKTFDLGASPPFAVVSGAAKVDNLDSDKLDGQDGTAYHDATLLTGVVPVANLPNNRALCCGRLSLTTAVPVTVNDVLAATTLRWALYGGNQITLYNGSAWITFIVAELSIAVPASTSQMYDVFVDYNAGTPALGLTAWTNDTTRATALTLQDGVIVLTGSTGKRWVGCMRTTGVSGQTEDSLAKRYVWNYYHRVPRALMVKETTSSWAYSIATWRQARATATNQLDVIVGAAEVPIDATISVVFANDTAAGVAGQVAFGEDSTSVALNTHIGGFAHSPSTNAIIGVMARLIKYPAIGRHTYVWLEQATATGVTTWRGGIGLSAATDVAGISGVING